MSGRKVWAADEVLTAEDLQDYIQDQVVFVYANASARSAGILAPTEGMVSYLQDTNALEVFDGSAWVDISPNVGTAGTYTKVTTDAKGRVSSGTTLAAADIPFLDTSKINTGTFDASRIASGTFDAARIPNLDAGKIVSGAFSADRIPSLDGGKITTGNISVPGSLRGTSITVNNGVGGSSVVLSQNGNVAIGGTLNVSSAAAVAGSLTCAPVYSTDLSSFTRRTVWISDGGLFGYAPSTKTVKQDIVSSAIDVDAVRQIDVVDFRYKKAVKENGDNAALEIGVIAEQLLELGLDQFVFFDDDCKPAGVHYEMLSVAVLRLVQFQADRLDALEARLDRLEK
jgi:hypothetical protein